MRGRYDGVVHLVTAADGAPEHYKYGVVEDDSGGQVCGLRAQQWTASPCLSVLLRAPSRRSIPHAVQPVHSLSTCVLCLHAYPPYPRAYSVHVRPLSPRIPPLPACLLCPRASSVSTHTPPTRVRTRCTGARRLLKRSRSIVSSRRPGRRMRATSSWAATRLKHTAHTCHTAFEHNSAHCGVLHSFS